MKQIKIYGHVNNMLVVRISDLKDPYRNIRWICKLYKTEREAISDIKKYYKVKINYKDKGKNKCFVIEGTKDNFIENFISGQLPYPKGYHVVS